MDVEQVDLGGLDVLDVDLHAQGPPHALLARLRTECPVHRGKTADGQEFWSLTRDTDVTEASRDTETFSSARGGIFLNPNQVLPLELTSNLLLYKDPPEHTKYRKILQSVFSPKAVREREPEVRSIVTRVIDDVIEAGSCDFVRDIAVRVPLGVLAGLMGIPDADIPKLYEWTEKIERSQQASESAAATPTFIEMAGYLHEQIANQIEEGGDSLVTRLREAEVDGESLTDDEILVFFGLLVFAGNDTTRNTASGGTLELLVHRAQWQMLCEDAELIPQAVEEVLRFTSVVKFFARTATKDTEVNGQDIAEGEKVLLWYSSASRDDGLAEDPQRFDVTRQDPEHRAFGGGGRHFCLGNKLARLELRVIFEELTRRMPELELDGEPEWLSSNWANSLTSLPVKFAPGAREAG